MNNDEFLSSVNTLVGCKYSVLKDLEKSFLIEKNTEESFNYPNW